jgi:hypothetical protein
MGAEPCSSGMTTSGNRTRLVGSKAGPGVALAAIFVGSEKHAVKEMAAAIAANSAVITFVGLSGTRFIS